MADVERVGNLLKDENRGWAFLWRQVLTSFDHHPKVLTDTFCGYGYGYGYGFFSLFKTHTHMHPPSGCSHAGVGFFSSYQASCTA
jgi:hypothetical protein